MKRAWASWVSLWDRREDATALALVRIGVAVVLLYDFVAMWWVGAIDALYAPPPLGYAAAVGWASPHALWLAVVLSLLALGLGLATRVAAVAFVILSAHLAGLAPDGDRGIDMVLRVVIAILALSRCNARWSLDAILWARVGRPIPREVPAWPRYLLMLQLVWVYFSGGINKGGAEWGPFGGFLALSNAVADPHLARFEPGGWLPVLLPVTRVATALVMLFELSAPVYLLAYARNWRRVRYAWLGLGVAFHLGIALTLRLGIFPWGMLVLYPVLLQPAELARRR